MGITSIDKNAPPIITISTIFIIVSMISIEMRDIPNAVLNAYTNLILFKRIIVSRIMLVTIPFIIANSIIYQVYHSY